MPEPRTIRCEECSQPVSTIRSNTKYCGSCRLLKDVEYINDRTAKCWQCDEVFAPIEKREKTCPHHLYQPKKFGETECAFCHKTALRVLPDIAVCHHCARDPQLRRRFLDSLRKKQATRRSDA